MQRMLSLSLVALTAVIAVVTAVPASAALTRNVIEEPSATVGNAYGVSLASDGDGGLLYNKRVGADEKVFYSRIVDGRAGVPTQVDTGQANNSRFGAISAAAGGRLIVTWENGGQAFYAVANSASSPLSAPQLLGPAATVAHTDVALSDSGKAYAVITDGTAVRGFYYDGNGWSSLNAGALNANNLHTAGGSLAEPKVAINASGKGAITWSEGPGGQEETFVRTVDGSTISGAIPQSVPTLDGALKEAGGFVRTPDVGIDSRGAVQVVFAEFFTYGATNKPRIVARQIVDGTPGPGTAVDGLGSNPSEGQEFPTLAVNGPGQALTASYRQLSLSATGAGFSGTNWSSPFDLGLGETAPQGVEAARPALGDGGAGAFVWSYQPVAAGDRIIKARLASPTSTSNDTLTLSEAGFGSGSDLGVPGRGDSPVGADQIGDLAAGFKQGTRMMLALEDRPPSEPKTQGPSGKLASGSGIRFAWAASIEPWGPVTYRVELDGKIVGATTDQTSLAAPDIVASGNHTWRVIAVDREGQTAASAAAGFSVPAKGGTLAFNKKRIKFRSPTISVPVVNGTTERVTGQLVASYGSGRKKSTAGKRRFAIAAGKTATVRVRISKRSLKQLKRKKKLRIKLSTTARTASGVKLPASATISIKYKRKR